MISQFSRRVASGNSCTNICEWWNDTATSIEKDFIKWRSKISCRPNRISTEPFSRYSVSRSCETAHWNQNAYWWRHLASLPYGQTTCTTNCSFWSQTSCLQIFVHLPVQPANWCLAYSKIIWWQIRHINCNKSLCLKTRKVCAPYHDSALLSLHETL